MWKLENGELGPEIKRSTTEGRELPYPADAIANAKSARALQALFSDKTLGAQEKTIFLGDLHSRDSYTVLTSVAINLTLPERESLARKLNSEDAYFALQIPGLASEVRCILILNLWFEDAYRLLPTAVQLKEKADEIHLFLLMLSPEDSYMALMKFSHLMAPKEKTVLIEKVTPEDAGRLLRLDATSPVYLDPVQRKILLWITAPTFRSNAERSKFVATPSDKKEEFITTLDRDTAYDLLCNISPLTLQHRKALLRRLDPEYAYRALLYIKGQEQDERAILLSKFDAIYSLRALRNINDLTDAERIQLNANVNHS